MEGYEKGDEFFHRVGGFRGWGVRESGNAVILHVVSYKPQRFCGGGVIQQRRAKAEENKKRAQSKGEEGAERRQAGL